MPNSHLENLPNEILLKVLHYLETQDLIRVSLLSQRIRPICHDETLWQTMNIHNGKVPIGLVELILNNGCKHLRFSNAELVGNMKLNKVSQLRYLVLQDCKCIAWDSPNEDFLETVMASCNSLENVSMNKLPLSSYMLKSMCHQNGNSLRVLNLEACRGYSGWKQHPLDLESGMIITSNCVNLKEVNFAKAQISESAINYLVENLTPNLEKLSLLCQSQITDKHVWALVNRCNKLCTLVLRNTCTTDASVTDIIEKLESTLEELDIHRFCYGYHVKPDKLFQLRKLPKFKVLNYSGASPDEIENLRRHLQLHNIRITDIKDQTNEGEISVAAAHNGQYKKDFDGIWEVSAKRTEMFKTTI